nr:hypothetical protein [Nitrosomonas nitrosa]
MALAMGHLVSGGAGLGCGILLTAVFVGINSDGDRITDDKHGQIARAAVEAAISADPSYCWSNDLDIPSAEEAQAAFRRGKEDTFPRVTITLGQCDKDGIGPGIVCMTRIVWGPNGEPNQRLVGFVKSADGWVATLY